MTKEVSPNRAAEVLTEVCQNRLKKLGLDGDERYTKRLKYELSEIIGKNAVSYFADLARRWSIYEKKHPDRTERPENENNLLVAYLLKIADSVDIDSEPNIVQGDFPDIDVDYIDVVRDVVKNEWVPKTFGSEYTCNICAYGTFKIAGALTDMARVHGLDHNEVKRITKKIERIETEEGETPWDATRRMVPEFAAYCDEHPDVAEATRKLVGRNRNWSSHAAGVIISNARIADTVPLLKRKGEPPVAAWPEGQNTQELQPVGFIKFDMLVIANQYQIAKGSELVRKALVAKKRISDLEEIDVASAIVGTASDMVGKICALPGQPNWSDVEKWRNDPLALAMADRGDLRGIFQFDSEGIRGVVKKGGVKSFDDLAAYTALYRPGPLHAGMHEVYVERKQDPNQKWRTELHPVLLEILDSTYGVMVYQEQIMKILNVVGKIPLSDCEVVRKAISKKKVEAFARYKDLFIKNGQQVLSAPKEELETIWSQIELFSEYGFNKSHSVAYTYISSQLLYLKAHYPLQFHAATLSVQSDDEKIRQYKREAELHAVPVERLDINRSDVFCNVNDDKVYFGFSQVKGIGMSAAERLVANQPYRDFEDFLTRYGTDAASLKPIIGLRCFKDADAVTLYKFAEHFKAEKKRFEDRQKRARKGPSEYDQRFADLFPEEKVRFSDLQELIPEEWAQYDRDEEKQVTKRVECLESESEYSRLVMTKIEDGVEAEIERFYKDVTVTKKVNRWRKLQDLWRLREKSFEKSANTKNETFVPPRLRDFDPSSWAIPEDVMTELRSPLSCEEKYYGFHWKNQLEASPDFNPKFVFDQFEDESVRDASVDLKLVKGVKKQGKKGEFMWAECEDANGQPQRIYIGPKDLEQFSQELQSGNLVRLRLNAPTPKFDSYSLYTPPWNARRQAGGQEWRVILLRKGEEERDAVLTNEEFMSQFDDLSI